MRPNCAQDDSAILMRTLGTGHEESRSPAVLCGSEAKKRGKRAANRNALPSRQGVSVSGSQRASVAAPTFSLLRKACSQEIRSGRHALLKRAALMHAVRMVDCLAGKRLDAIRPLGQQRPRASSVDRAPSNRHRRSGADAQQVPHLGRRHCAARAGRPVGRAQSRAPLFPKSIGLLHGQFHDTGQLRAR